MGLDHVRGHDLDVAVQSMNQGTANGESRVPDRFSDPIPVNKAEELGAFEMGSTVILLFQRGRVRWDDGLVEGSRVRMGQRIGVMA